MVARQFYQHKKYAAVEPHDWLPKYLLRSVIVLLLGIILVAGLTAGGWEETVFAAPARQYSSAAVVAAGGGHLYTTPGGKLIMELAPATVLTALGRSGDNLWIVVRTNTGLTGWVEASETTIFGLEQLPVMLIDTPQVASPETNGGTVERATPLVPNPTPTVSPSATSVPSPTQVPATTSLVAVVKEDVVSQGVGGLYDQPNGAVIEQLIPGTALMVGGRTDDGQWLSVNSPLGSSGWVQTVALIITNLEDLPVLETAKTTQPPAATASENAQSTPEPNRIIATVKVGSSRLNIRSGPGTEFQVLGLANNGALFEVTGRNDAATWIYVLTPGIGSGMSWIAADFAILSHSISAVPVVETSSQAASSTVPPSTAAIVTGDIGCTNNQIVKWDGMQSKWICSDDMTALQADLATLRAEVAALRAEIATLKSEIRP
jgi:uncharacterized protein YraI